MKASLWTDFSKTDKHSWLRRAERELKGRPYEEVLFRPATSVQMEPYYTSGEVNESDLKIIQQAQKQNPGWLTIPIVTFDEAGAVNSRILQQLAGGAEGLWLSCGDHDLDTLDLTKTLFSVRLTDTPVYFASSVPPPSLIEEILHGSGYYLKGGVVHDPLATWMRAGTSTQGAYDQIAQAITATQAMREFRCFGVESHVFHESGADTVQELAFTLASFVTYMDQLTDRDVPALLAATRFVFSVSVGTDYLTEIAKLRALRYLYRKITDAYALPAEQCQAFVHAQSSRLYQSAHSPHTNLVRRTSEAMSAVVGGCDALSIEPHDALYDTPSDFSERIARNISLLLKNEALLDRVADPAAGAYYLELETQKLATAAWDLFLEIEQQGGLVKAFEKNIIQEEIKKLWHSRVEEYHNGRVLVGANKYREENQVEKKPAEVINKELSPDWEYALLKPQTLDRIF
jgi:methylmalonyl-CoA mutase